MTDYAAAKYVTGSMLLLAEKSCKRSQEDKQESLTAILLSALAFECFINELEDMASRYITSSDADNLQALRDFLVDLEKGDAQIKLKIKTIYYFLTTKRLDMGTLPYQDFNFLTDLRNALVHRKPEKFNWPLSSPDKEYDAGRS